MRLRLTLVLACAGLVAVAVVAAGFGGSPKTTTIVYDDFSSGDNSKWISFGGELSSPDADHFESFVGGVERVRSVPFRTGLDFGPFDHAKYFEIAKSSFPVPAHGSVEFEADIGASTPGTIEGLVQHGIYGPGGTWTDPSNPPKTPDWSGVLLESQQAAAAFVRHRFLHR